MARYAKEIPVISSASWLIRKAAASAEMSCWTIRLYDASGATAAVPPEVQSAASFRFNKF